MFFVLCMVLLVVPMVSSYVYHDVVVKYRDGGFSLSGTDVVYERYERVNLFIPGSDYPKVRVDLYDENGMVVYSEWVSVPTVGVADFGDVDGNIIDSREVFLEDYEYHLLFPYRENVNSIAVFDDEGNEIDLVDSSVYAMVRLDEMRAPVRSGNATFLDFNFFYFIIVLIGLLVIAILLYYLLSRKRR